MPYSFATSWTVACQASLSMEVSRQEYCSGLSFPSPGDLSDPGIKPRSPALQAGFFFFFFLFPAEPPGTRVFSVHSKPTQYCKPMKTLQVLKLTYTKSERERERKKKRKEERKKDILSAGGQRRAKLTGYPARKQAPVTGKACVLRLRLTLAEAGCAACPPSVGRSWPAREPHIPPAHPFPPGAGVFHPDGHDRF